MSIVPRGVLEVGVCEAGAVSDARGVREVWGAGARGAFSGAGARGAVSGAGARGAFSGVILVWSILCAERKNWRI